MRTVDDYLDAAIEKQELGSDRQLARLIGIAQTSISQFRTRRSFPSDETMVKLARLAGLDEQVALIELSFLRADGEAKTAFEAILRRICSFLPATLFGAVALETTAAHASNLEVIASGSLPFAAATGIAGVCVTKCLYNVSYDKYTIFIINNNNELTEIVSFVVEHRCNNSRRLAYDGI